MYYIIKPNPEGRSEHHEVAVFTSANRFMSQTTDSQYNPVFIPLPYSNYIIQEVVNAIIDSATK